MTVSVRSLVNGVWPTERGVRHGQVHRWGVVPGVVYPGWWVPDMVRTLGGARGTGPGVPVPLKPRGFSENDEND